MLFEVRLMRVVVGSREKRKGKNLSDIKPTSEQDQALLLSLTTRCEG